MGVMGDAEEEILRDRSACLRALWALKAGRAPREGVRYLSVGLDGTIQKLQQAFEQAMQGTAQILWLIGDYGEGKSHLLRLVTALAEEHGFAWAYVVHDKNQNIGLHKPARLFRQILWSLQWEHPSVNLLRFHNEMTNPPSYDIDWRYELPKRLAELTDWLKAQGWHGLVICLDEVENCCQFHWNQHYPAWETLNHLHRRLNGPVLLCLAITNGGLEMLKNLWSWYAWDERDKVEALLNNASTNGVTMPNWTEKFALPLAERIHRLHGTAFGWEPTVSVEEVAMEASEQARATQSGRWRIFVQAVVNALERAHQKAIVPQPVATKPPETVPAIPKTLPTLPVLVSSPKPSLPKIHPGDRVEIVRTQFRGFRGIVEAVKGDEVEIVLDGRTPMRIKLPLDAIKKLR
jgi:transcription antitermination factor NusG